MDWPKDVQTFYKAIGFKLSLKHWPKEKLIHDQTRFFEEKLLDFLDGLNTKDTDKTVKASVSMIYALIGLSLILGIDIKKVWKHKQKCNMELVHLLLRNKKHGGKRSKQT